jgi:hypothetical protein
VLDAVVSLAGPVRIRMTPQEVPWTVSLDEDDEHRTYDMGQVSLYFSAATRAAFVLADLRSPYRGRSSPVNAWWGSFDLAISLFSGRSATPPSHDFIMRNSANAEEIAVGWWPGDGRHARPAFFGYAFPSPEGLREATLSPQSAYYDGSLGEFLLDWDDVVAAEDPRATAFQFGRSLISHACEACDWDPFLKESAEGSLAPLA